jgi:hypothetical protein
VLALGVHLDDPFPEPLRELSDAELAALLTQFACVAPEPEDCGAQDWAILEQRMHYIAHLFRAFHATEDLYRPPFTDQQVEHFTAGRVPLGDL